MHVFKKGDPDYHDLLNTNFKEVSDSVAKIDTATVKKSDLLNLMYPVGSIFQSTVSTNPSGLFGGTWERVQGRFLVAASDSDTDFTAAKTGGRKTLASHKHTVGESVQTTDVASGALVASKTNFTGVPDPSTTEQLPPYLAVYMWKRTA